LAQQLPDVQNLVLHMAGITSTSVLPAWLEESDDGNVKT
jgi:hypothetical protein